MDLDMTVAAAYSSGNTFQLPVSQHQQSHQHGKRPRQSYYEQQNPGQAIELEAGEDLEGSDWRGLPNVDDLEVAADAAEAAMEAARFYEDVGEGTSSKEDSSSEEEEEEEEGASSSSEDEGTDIPKNKKTKGPMAVSLRVSDTGEVHMDLDCKAAAEDNADSEAGSEGVDADMLQEMLAHMVEDGEDAQAAAREAAEAEAGLPPVQPLDVIIEESDTLLPAGTVSAVLDRQIVVQAGEGLRALDEGSVLCLADRAPLGRIEELFGPVVEPLYTLRYAGSGPLPDTLQPGASVCSVERFNVYVLPEAIKAKVENELDEEAQEFEFSDDDAEAVFQRHHPSTPSTSYPQQSSKPRGGHGRYPNSATRTQGRFGNGQSSPGQRGSGRGRGWPGRPGWQYHQAQPNGLSAQAALQGQQRGWPMHPEWGGSHRWQISEGHACVSHRGRASNSAPDYASPPVRESIGGAIPTSPGFGGGFHGYGPGAAAQAQQGRPQSALPQGGQWVWVPPEQLEPLLTEQQSGARPLPQGSGGWPSAAPAQPGPGPAGAQMQPGLHQYGNRQQAWQQTQQPLPFYPRGLP